MSTEVCGIDNIKRIFNIGIVLGMAAEANVPAWKDGKTDAQDFSFALKLPSVVADLINMQFTQVVPEIKDVSATEAQELFAFFNEHYKSPNAKVEEIVEKGLATVATVIGFIQGLIAIIKA